ncbi:MAG TPA: single-stranded DNA-binding protein [Levilinea sp.]|nr:single-stranded DNA-binding protein [Levilinea sp.]
MYHTIIIVGNVGKDPEMRYTPGGQAVTSFSVASSRNYTNSSGQRIDETIWFRISAWGRQAETCNQYLKKGSKVLVEGRLTADANGGPRIWTRQDGTPGASFEVSASTVRFLSSRSEGGMEEGGEHAIGEDEIPF